MGKTWDQVVSEYNNAADNVLYKEAMNTADYIFDHLISELKFEDTEEYAGFYFIRLMTTFCRISEYGKCSYSEYEIVNDAWSYYYSSVLTYDRFCELVKDSVDCRIIKIFESDIKKYYDFAHALYCFGLSISAYGGKVSDRALRMVQYVNTTHFRK